MAPSLAATKKKRGKKPVGLGPVVTATATGPVATVPATTSDAMATCPPRLQVVGGGFSAPFNSAGALVVRRLPDVKRPPGGASPDPRNEHRRRLGARDPSSQGLGRGGSEQLDRRAHDHCFSSPFASGVLPVHADGRIVGSGFSDTAVNGGSVTGPMTVRSQAICF